MGLYLLVYDLSLNLSCYLFTRLRRELMTIGQCCLLLSFITWSISQRSVNFLIDGDVLHMVGLVMDLLFIKTRFHHGSLSKSRLLYSLWDRCDY